MTRRLANLQFQRDVVRLGVEADLLGDLLYTLPADAHVVGFSEDLFTQTVNIVVQSNRFPEQVLGSELPSFTAIFTEDDYGNVHVDTDIDEVFPRDFDMPTDDDVIGDEDKIRGMELTHCYIDEWEGFKVSDFMGEHCYPVIGINSEAGALTVETLREGIIHIPEGTEIKPEYLETQCSHQWENYTGLNETFEYCVHCDEKRNIRKG